MKITMEESRIAEFLELFFCVRLMVERWAPRSVQRATGTTNTGQLVFPKLLFHTMIYSSNTYKGDRKKYLTGGQIFSYGCRHQFRFCVIF